MIQYKTHPAANSFPMMDKDRYNDLLMDIKTNGQLEPITICEDMILDGRNRYKACVELGVEPVIKVFNGNPWAYSWSLNGQRRDLDAEQRYLIWTECNKHSKEWSEQQLLIQEEANRKRSESQIGISKNDISERNGTNCASTFQHKTRELKAILSNTNKGAVQRGDKLLKERPDLAKQVMMGEIKSSDAHNIIKQEKNEIYHSKESEKKSIVDKDTPIPILYNCDILSSPIEDNSIDVIITDPPYPKEFLDCWDKLAQFAAAKLKDGGVLVAMSGQSYLPEVYKRMTIDGLNYYWTCCISTPGASANMRQKRLNSNWKPLLFYVKGNYTRTFLNTDIFVSEYKDTNSSQLYHKWGQSYPLTKSIVEKFTYANDVVCDPFAGGGTTLLASMELKRKVIGIEIDNTNYKTILDRIGDANDYTS